MYCKTIEIAGRKINISAGRDTIGSIVHHIKAPLDVQQSTGCICTAIFSGPVWNWSDFPAEKKTAYDRDLAEFAAKIPDNVTARTVLPSNRWMYKYIPKQSELDGMKEAKKTDADREAERW